MNFRQFTIISGKCNTARGSDSACHGPGNGLNVPKCFLISDTKLMETSKTFKDFALPFAAVLITALLLGAVLGHYTIADDAYITYRYSRNLAEGHGPVWNLGERVEGYTCFLHMVLCSGAIKAGIDPGKSSQAISLLALALTVHARQVFVAGRLHTAVLGHAMEHLPVAFARALAHDGAHGRVGFHG